MPTSSDVIYIGGSARKRIERETGQDLSKWSGPNVTTGENGDYKVEWRPPDDDSLLDMPGYEDAVLTIYKDGAWDLYALDGKSFDGSMMPFHDRRWIRLLVKEGVVREMAMSSWMYFKDIALGGKG